MPRAHFFPQARQNYAENALAKRLGRATALVFWGEEKVRRRVTWRELRAGADIPRTKSGKITEIAVREVIMGREIKNREALANPEALELFQGIEELRS